MSQTRKAAPRFGLRSLLIASGALILLAGVAAAVEVRYQSEPVAVPVKTEIALPTPGVAPARKAEIAPDFDIVRVSPEGGAIIAGSAAPDQAVIVRDGGKEIGHTTADHAGQWVLTPDKPLDPGARELTLASRGAGGGETAGRGSVLLVVPDHAGTAPAQPPLAVLTPSLPGAGARVLQAPGLAAASGKSERLDLDVIDYDDHGAITFAGHAPPDAQLRLYVDNQPIGGAVGGAQSTWTVTPGAIAAGKHRVRVDQVDAHGRVVSRVELPFLRESLPAQALAGGRVVVQPGQNLWRIARQAYGSGGRYTVIYAYNSDQIRNPSLIYPGQGLVIPDAATAASGGSR